MWSLLTPSQKADLLKVIIPTIGVVAGTITSIILFLRNKRKR